MHVITEYLVECCGWKIKCNPNLDKKLSGSGGYHGAFSKLILNTSGEARKGSTPQDNFESIIFEGLRAWHF